MRIRMFQILTVFDVWSRYDLSRSLCPCTTNRTLHRSLSMLRFLIATMIGPPSLLAFLGILLEGAKANDFRAKKPSISSLIIS